jgi:hypothetical protein
VTAEEEDTLLIKLSPYVSMDGKSIRLSLFALRDLSRVGIKPVEVIDAVGSFARDILGVRMKSDLKIYEEDGCIVYQL